MPHTGEDPTEEEEEEETPQSKIARLEEDLAAERAQKELAQAKLVQERRTAKQREEDLAREARNWRTKWQAQQERLGPLERENSRQRKEWLELDRQLIETHARLAAEKRILRQKLNDTLRRLIKLEKTRTLSTATQTADVPEVLACDIGTKTTEQTLRRACAVLKAKNRELQANTVKLQKEVISFRTQLEPAVLRNRALRDTVAQLSPVLAGMSLTLLDWLSQSKENVELFNNIIMGEPLERSTVAAKIAPDRYHFTEWLATYPTETPFARWVTADINTRFPFARWCTGDEETRLPLAKWVMEADIARWQFAKWFMEGVQKYFPQESIIDVIALEALLLKQIVTPECAACVKWITEAPEQRFPFLRLLLEHPQEGLAFVKWIEEDPRSRSIFARRLTEHHSIRYPKAEVFTIHRTVRSREIIPLGKVVKALDHSILVQIVKPECKACVKWVAEDPEALLPPNPLFSKKPQTRISLIHWLTENPETNLPFAKTLGLPVKKRAKLIELSSQYPLLEQCVIDSNGADQNYNRTETTGTKKQTQGNTNSSSTENDSIESSNNQPQTKNNVNSKHEQRKLAIHETRLHKEIELMIPFDFIYSDDDNESDEETEQFIIDEDQLPERFKEAGVIPILIEEEEDDDLHIDVEDTYLDPIETLKKLLQHLEDTEIDIEEIRKYIAPHIIRYVINITDSESIASEERKLIEDIRNEKIIMPIPGDHNFTGPEDNACINTFPIQNKTERDLANFIKEENITKYVPGDHHFGEILPAYDASFIM